MSGSRRGEGEGRRVPWAWRLLVLALVLPTSGLAAAPDPGPGPFLACRLASYGAFQESAWEHLTEMGVRYVFLSVPARDQVSAVKARLAKHNLTVAVMRGDTELSRDTCLEELAEQLEICAQFGVKFMFLSPKHPGITREAACARLREAGEVARRHGVTITLETHPDLGTNGDVHLETMKRIDHPNVRVNFDTGNITYYNPDRDAPTELRKIIAYVATVEFKDHDGRLESWHFPALGRGRVDFPRVLEILREHGYAGPITLEIEGIRGVTWDQAQTRQAIAASVAYVRSLGL